MVTELIKTCLKYLNNIKKQNGNVNDNDNKLNNNMYQIIKIINVCKSKKYFRILFSIYVHCCGLIFDFI